MNDSASSTSKPASRPTAAQREQKYREHKATRKARQRGAIPPGKGSIRGRWGALPRPVQWAYMLPIVVLAYMLPLINPPLISTEPDSDFPLTLVIMAIYALVALGLNIVVGYAGLLDLGYVAFFAVGAYVAAMFTSPDSPFLKIPYLWTLPLAILLTMLFGVLLGFPVLRLRGDYLAIVTLGFGEIIRLLATIVPLFRGSLGFRNIGAPPGEIDGRPLFNSADGIPWYWLILSLIIITLLLVGNLERSRAGRAWVAVREDEDAAEIMGVPTFRFKIWAFAMGAAFGGLAGALQSGVNGYIDNTKFDVATSILFLCGVILGGAGNKWGVLIGGALVAYLPLRFTGIAEVKFLIFGLALVLLMIFRSQGLFPARQKLLAYSRRVYWRIRTLTAAAETASADKITAGKSESKGA